MWREGITQCVRQDRNTKVTLEDSYLSSIRHYIFFFERSKPIPWTYFLIDQWIFKVLKCSFKLTNWDGRSSQREMIHSSVFIEEQRKLAMSVFHILSTKLLEYFLAVAVFFTPVPMPRAVPHLPPRSLCLPSSPHNVLWQMAHLRGHSCQQALTDRNRSISIAVSIASVTLVLLYNRCVWANKIKCKNPSCQSDSYNKKC